MWDFPVNPPDGKGWERSSMRNLSDFKMICFPSVHGNNLWQLCIAGKECEMGWVEPERFCCWGNTLWPARKNVKIYTRSNCHSPSLIPSPDFSYLKSRNYTPAKKVGKNWKHGKRSTLIKVRSEVKFQDNMQRDALFRGVPFCRSNGGGTVCSMGAFLTSEMDRRFAYPLMFGASRFATYQSEPGVSLFTVPLRGKKVWNLSRIVYHSYRSE